MIFYKNNQILCLAKIDKIYTIICNSENWPNIFKPCLSVKTIEKNSIFEHIQITALIHGAEATWESQRFFQPELYGITSVVLKPMPLVKSMKTIWRIIPINSEQNILLLEHQYEILEDISNIVDCVDTKQEAQYYIETAIENNSKLELNNIKNAVECDLDNRKSWSTIHSVICDVSQFRAYEIIKNMEKWPEMLEMCISVERIDKMDNKELLKVTAESSSGKTTWETERTYYDDQHIVDFVLLKPMPLLKKMNGKWRIIYLSDNKSIISVERHFEILENVEGIINGVTNHSEAIRHINKFINENSEIEMNTIKKCLEENSYSYIHTRNIYFSKIDAAIIYEAFSNINLWGKILSHCDKMEIIYNDSKYQEFLMEIPLKNGRTNKVRSIRNCNKNEFSISYFQPDPPDILKTHYGSWKFVSEKGGTSIISEHIADINIKEANEFFQDTNLMAIKKTIKDLIVKNSETTIESIQQWLIEKHNI